MWHICVFMKKEKYFHDRFAAWFCFPTAQIEDYGRCTHKTKTMEKVLKYSVLRYSPSILAGEKINLGILFSEESVGYHSFYYTHNFGRIKSFDDEINESVMKEFLLGIEEEISSELHDSYFYIEKYIKYYINDYKFEAPQVIMYDDLDAVIRRLIKVYFRFDFERSERPDGKAD